MTKEYLHNCDMILYKLKGKQRKEKYDYMDDIQKLISIKSIVIFNVVLKVDITLHMKMRICNVTHDAESIYTCKPNLKNTDASLFD